MPDDQLPRLPATALAAAEGVHPGLLEALGVAVYTTDAEGRLTSYNEAAVALWGWRPPLGEARWCGSWRLFYPDGRPMRHEDCPMGITLREGRAVRGAEAIAERPDGTRVPFIPYPSPLRDAAGEIIGAVNVLVDISARKATEVALAESEALKGAVLAGALDCVITIDHAGQVVEWNPAAEQTFGYVREVALGRDVAELIIPPERREAHRRGLAGYLTSGNGPLLKRRVEVEAQRADGSRFPAELAITPTAVGGRVLFTAYLRDITDRRHAEAALRESEGQLRDLLTTLDLGAFMARDFAGTIRFWSAGCERLYGWTAAEAVGRPAHQLLQTVFPVPLPEIEAALLRDGEWSGDLEQRRRDGTAITVAVRKALRRDAAGQPLAIVENVADVTALRQTRTELRRLNEELETRVRTEVAAREAAQARLAQAEKMTALGQLAGGIAHDFNNILQAVQGGASLIRRRAANPAAVERLAGMVQDAARRGTSVTRRLLAFARRDELRAEPVQVPELLGGLREVLGHTLGAGITICLDVAQELPPVLADRGQLEAALVNLATNARDAMPDGGTLTLSAHAAAILDEHATGLTPGAYVRLAVADTGTGMDAATLARAAEPFFTTKPQGKGTGLGLAMARGFAEQSGGGMVIESQPGRGTKVTLLLPAAAKIREVTSPGQSEDGVPVVGPRAPHILLVDDERLVREVLATQLADYGYDVVEAGDATTALELLAAGESVDLLVTDLSMPGMDGIALIREAQRRRPRLPAILLTGYAGEAAALAVGGAISGSFSLLRKPASGAQLADRVAALLETMAIS